MIHIPKKLEYAANGRRKGEATINQSTFFCWIPNNIKVNPMGKYNGHISRHMFHEACKICAEFIMMWPGQNPKIMNDTPKTTIKMIIDDFIIDLSSACAPNPSVICGLDIATKGHHLTGKNIPASISASIWLWIII